MEPKEDRQRVNIARPNLAPIQFARVLVGPKTQASYFSVLRLSHQWSPRGGGGGFRAEENINLQIYKFWCDKICATSQKMSEQMTYGSQ